MGKTRSKKMVTKGDGGSRMRELDLIKQRLKLNIREYTKIIEKDNRSVTRLKRLGIEIRRDMLMVEDNYWEYLLMEAEE